MKTSRMFSIKMMTTTAVLIALAIIIPIYMPKITLPIGASFTLASHVPLVIAMFISPVSAAMVAIGSTIGFFAASFPPVVVARAATHLLWAIPGSYLIIKTMENHIPVKKWILYCVEVLGISIAHGLFELMVVYFFFDVAPTDGFSAFFIAVVLPLGILTAVHGVIDFCIATPIYLAVKRYINTI